MRPAFGLGEDWNWANLAEDKDISDESIVEEMLRSLGQPDTWIERSRSPENKKGLKRQTQRAMNPGVFGEPSFAAGDGVELFRGGDRMEEALEQAAKGTSP